MTQVKGERKNGRIAEEIKSYLMKAPELEVEENWREESDEGEGDDGGTEESRWRKSKGKSIAPISRSVPNMPLEQRSPSQSAWESWQRHLSEGRR